MKTIWISALFVSTALVPVNAFAPLKSLSSPVKTDKTTSISKTALIPNLVKSTKPVVELTAGHQVLDTAAPLFGVNDFLVNGNDTKAKKSVILRASRVKVASRHAGLRKKWGVDNLYAQEYWFDHRIHTLGNIGIGGALHAALAPISTKIIDLKAYDGIDIRAKVAQTLSQTIGKSKARVLDLCCGVGISTRALHEAFPDAETVVGIDSSPQMIAMAKFLASHLQVFRPLWAVISEHVLWAMVSDKFSSVVTAVNTAFERGNAEKTNWPDKEFDLVTIMYAFHEVPTEGRDRILSEAYRVLKPGGTLAVIDISIDYKPSRMMLAGEPYVIDYQKTINNQLRRLRGFVRPRYQNLVSGHVGMWTLQRA